jgi:L-rhamnose isomerase
MLLVVKSPDTKVHVLDVHYFPKMKNTSELWFQTGLITSTKDCRRYIPVHELFKSLNSVVCEILPAAHALTGCDITSSFFGIGKKSMFKVLKETPNQFSDLSRIECSDIDDSVDLS